MTHQKPKVMASLLVRLTKPKDINFTILSDKDKLNIFTIWHFCLKKDLKDKSAKQSTN